ncbi:hypothetical protein H0E87_021526 [Populus deltoides]|uniref:ZF-HD dimerization-type domain-containing protein n=1 Tax=Populus deltoides TaxID=3696 RepID=A0A8T2XFK4_POPDE|nr:hypothetical protein H0E87_021526 [Populus deltoides]
MESDSTNDLYKECLRNHAASLGSYATDGCGEFTLDDTSVSTLQCAACGCHRNFHRKVSYSNRRDHIMHSPSSETVVMEMMDYAEGNNERNSRPPVMVVESGERSGKKRFRTKFTAEQREKMMEFAEKLGWKLQRKDEEDEVERFCEGIGVSRQVFKVWMHNHKNSSSTTSASPGNASSLTTQPPLCNVVFQSRVGDALILTILNLGADLSHLWLYQNYWTEGRYVTQKDSVFMLRNWHTATDETELKPELPKLTALGNAILHFDKIEKDHGLDLKWRDPTGSLL